MRDLQFEKVFKVKSFHHQKIVPLNFPLSIGSGVNWSYLARNICKIIESFIHRMQYKGEEKFHIYFF